jgi:hypothetical protein
VKNILIPAVWRYNLKPLINIAVLFAINVIIIIAFEAENLFFGRLNLGGLWIYIFGALPYFLLSLTAISGRFNKLINSINIIYFLIYIYILIYNEFYSSSGIDLIALIMLPIYVSIFLLPLAIIALYLFIRACLKQRYPKS